MQDHGIARGAGMRPYIKNEQILSEKEGTDA